MLNDNSNEYYEGLKAFWPKKEEVKKGKKKMANIKTLKMGQDKKCNNKCPQCGAVINDENTVIGKSVFDQFPFQEFECLKCGCYFEEVYKYSISIKTGQRNKNVELYRD